MNTRQLLPLFARILISAIFILSGFNKIVGWEATAGYMSSQGLPLVPLLLAGAIMVELAGGLLLLVGYRVELVGTLLFLFLIPATLIFHNFWAVDPAQQQAQMTHFLKNLAIMGGLLQLVWSGTGSYSLGDNPQKAQAKA